MKKTHFFLFLLCCSFHFSIAQNQTIDSLKTLYSKTHEDKLKVNILSALSSEFKSNNPDTALVLAEMALGLAREIHYDTGVADAFLGIGMANKYLANYDFAIKYLNEAMTIYNNVLHGNKENKIRKSISNAYNELGLVYSYKADYSAALKNHKECLRIRLEINDKDGVAGCYSNIGLIYASQSNYTEALKNYFAAIEINEKSGNKNWLSVNYNNIGNLYENLGNYKEALKNHFISLKIRQEINDKKGIGSCYNNIGLIYEDQGKYDIALKYYSYGLELRKEISDKRGVSTSYSMIGSIYKKLTDYDKALRFYSASLKIKESMGDQKGIGTLTMNIGEVYLDQKKYNLAGINLTKALGIIAEGRHKSLLKTVYKELAILDSATGNFKSSLEHFKLYRIYQDSLKSEDVIRNTTQMAMANEFKKKEAFIRNEQGKREASAQANLSRQVIIRNSIGGIAVIILFSSFISFMFYKRNRESQALHKEFEFRSKMTEYEMKALRAQINPHFIFNCLNAVQRYILKNDKLNAVEYLDKFASLMRMILNNSEKEKVNIREELTMLEYYIQLESLRFDEGFDYEINVDQSINKDSEELPSMILQPFIENAIWHGLMHKHEKGKIRVEIRHEEMGLKCTIEDNGVGREKAAEIKRSQPRIHKSKGMEITSTRIELMNIRQKSKNSFQISDLHDSDNHPAGTRVELFFQAA